MRDDVRVSDAPAVLAVNVNSSTKVRMYGTSRRLSIVAAASRPDHYPAEGHSREDAVRARIALADDAVSAGSKSCTQQPAAYNRTVRFRAAILVLSTLWCVIAPLATFAAVSIVRTSTAESISAPIQCSAESWAPRASDAHESVTAPQKHPRSPALGRTAVRLRRSPSPPSRSAARFTRARAYPARRTLRAAAGRSNTSSASPA